MSATRRRQGLKPTPIVSFSVKRKRGSAQPQYAKRKRGSAQPQYAKRKRGSAQPQ